MAFRFYVHTFGTLTNTRCPERASVLMATCKCVRNAAKQIKIYRHTGEKEQNGIPTKIIDLHIARYGEACCDLARTRGGKFHAGESRAFLGRRTQ